MNVNFHFAEIYFEAYKVTTLYVHAINMYNTIVEGRLHQTYLR